MRCEGREESRLSAHAAELKTIYPRMLHMVSLSGPNGSIHELVGYWLAYHCPSSENY